MRNGLRTAFAGAALSGAAITIGALGAPAALATPCTPFPHVPGFGVTKFEALRMPCAEATPLAVEVIHDRTPHGWQCARRPSNGLMRMWTCHEAGHNPSDPSTRGFILHFQKR